MKRIYLNICTFVALALVATSCTKDPFGDSIFVSTPSNTIMFGVADIQVDVITRGGQSKSATLDFTESKLVSENGEMSLPMMVKVEKGIHRAVAQEPRTRANAVTETSQITMLSAWAIAKKEGTTPELYINDVDFTKGSDNIFRSATPYLWKDAETKFDFFVVANHIASFEPKLNEAEDHIVSFDYTVPTNADEQFDLLVAERHDVPGNKEESVQLNFKHVLSAVNVKVGSDVVSGTIRSIKFKGVYNKGTYRLEEHQWTDRTIEGEGEDKGVFNVPLPNGGLTITAGDGANTPISTMSFMMIPQQLYTGAEVEIVFYDNTLRREETLRASIQGDVWEMNTTTNYLININGDYGLEIVPLDKVIDSHYVITKVEVSSDYPIWELGVAANDGADVTILREEEVNPMAKQGFWTDKYASKDNTGKYYIASNAESARGGDNIGSSTSVTKQVVYVFIPENVSGNDRTITLTLIGAGSDNLAQKTLTLTQHPVKWLDPTGAGNPDKSWGCEFLLEGGPIDWGFCWEGITEEYITTQGNQTQVPPGQLKHVEQKMEAAGFDLDLLHDPNYYINLVQKSNNNQGWLLQINYSKIGNIEIADSLYNGYSNTLELYNFDGISTLASIKDFIASQDNIVYTSNSGEANIANTLDFAAMYAMKRNRFHLYDAGENLYIPVIEEKDINWYLPARDQFPILMQSNWGQVFNWNDSYWTSTAYLAATGTDNAHSYAYINGIATIAHRTSPYLTMAIRRRTYTADVVIKPEDIVIPGAGENGQPSGSGGGSNGDTGGDQTGGTQ